ncbi:MAG: hypothetical protein NT007_04540 [Candidatus Kapabacteria bacterium]|nr:hypothetical protein [Candidatus Kapabacteria bacterium]
MNKELLSKIQMQESPTRNSLGDSRIRDCVKTSISVIHGNAEIPNCAMEGDSRMRGNDRYVNISCFHTVSFAGMSTSSRIQKNQLANMNNKYKFYFNNFVYVEIII